MDFEKYKADFAKQAYAIGYNQDAVERLLSYAEVLASKRLPVIYDFLHLSLLVGIDADLITRMCYSIESFYRKFSIAKKNGKLRKISEPLPTLKNIQKWIQLNILDSIEPSKYSKAFKKGTSVKENAKFHRNQKTLVCMDIKDYFGSINEFRVRQYFLELGYNPEVSTTLAKLCCLNGSLPQGAPTSPSLSNQITIGMDNAFADFARALSTQGNTVRYTRYADDISFSGNSLSASMVIAETKKILKKYQFELNESKTRVLGQHMRQVVTGVVVNEKLQVSVKKRKELRQIMYYIKKHGIQSHMVSLGISEIPKRYIWSLLGQINFVLHINPNDHEFQKYKSHLIECYKGMDS